MAIHLSIAGKVQGVGYRASFAARARELNVSGWVRNRVDGSVEAVVQGEPESLRQIVEWARRGPASARVGNVAVDEIDDSPVRTGNFQVLATA